MTSGLPPGVDLLGLASSFLLVIGLLAVLLFALKRMQGLSGGLSTDRQIKHLETMPAGARQKIVLLKVKDREILVGISAGAMVTLAEWKLSENQGQGTGSNELSGNLIGNAEGRPNVGNDDAGSNNSAKRTASFAQVMSGLSVGPRPVTASNQSSGPLSRLTDSLALSLRRLVGRS
jgi:flagellar protein FliO/FliZ